ncbi:MAG: transporter substrate-binding protein [Paenibacillaceae bacterium]|jgi:putative aldouronate transport system substrate-binding protein|nr:transporter substrate-binding protein [Paenibacillaceae bacterium]
MKHTKKQRLGACAILVFLLSANVLGCAKEQEQADTAAENFNKTGYPIVNDQLTLSMFEFGEWKNLYFYKGMEQKTNIHFDFVSIPSTAGEERKQLAFASNELPDLLFMWGLKPVDEMKYGSQGQIMPLEELIEQYAPNIQKLLSDNPEIRQSITTPDGHIYALPQVTDHPRDRYNRLFINGEWMERLGKTALPQTTDELYQLLKDFKEKDPNGNKLADEIPLTGRDKLSYLRPVLLSYFGHLSNFVEIADEKARYVPLQNGFKEYMAFMQKLYREKLLDNEIFSQNQAQMVAKGEQGLYGVMANSMPIFGGKDKQVLPDQILNNPQMPPLVSSAGAKPVVAEKATIRTGAFAISSTNKHPEATIRWLDFLYSEEGYKYAQYGIEGESYKWSGTEPKYVEYLVPQGMTENDFKNQKVSNLGYGFANEELERKFVKKDWLGFLLNDQAQQYVPYAKKAFPQTYFTDKEAERINVISVDLNTFVEQLEAKIVVGQESVDNWETHANRMRTMGADELVSIYQTAYDRWKAAR